ncbi:hypothetical protein, unlikely [Trypanosoma brucei gambiense DAL972]|uniref:Uncharacterized protein n=1 Tax=Trypanosoma brucei gambiense (strain MHOM/CI/86/DAL972) TaxID=679716 RepID=C9ZNA9_TRYB9|nr:hypothetical protein, unlikely [Trypanosoma brucei gambiense DAL972]CBH10887.1 hypothetical protein, unlikely [Trypanosoma brucei gambiense DAL972]|eukprot:XP_011773174.1 hypothetical protein, unlikely [Trypanosoma brucei gambiense DAL972]
MLSAKYRRAPVMAAPTAARWGGCSLFTRDLRCMRPFDGYVDPSTRVVPFLFSFLPLLNASAHLLTYKPKVLPLLVHIYDNTHGKFGETSVYLRSCHVMSCLMWWWWCVCVCG